MKERRRNLRDPHNPSEFSDLGERELDIELFRSSSERNRSSIGCGDHHKRSHNDFKVDILDF